MADSIILIIENKTPIHADALGELFTAFARDYRDMSRGRTLVVARLENGSTFVEWTDLILTNAGHYAENAVETIKAIKSLANFAATLKSFFGKKIPEKPLHPAARRKKRQAAQRAAVAIAKIAAENRCHVRVKSMTTAQGETLEFELTPAEAIEFQNAARNERKATRGLEQDQIRRIDLQQVAETVPALTTSVRQLIDARGGNLSKSEIDQIVETIVAVLESSRLSHVAEHIASGFEAHGLDQVAKALRHKLPRSSGKHEPPQRTT